MIELIQKKLDVLQPHIVDVINESHLHAGPATTSHFKLIVVSDQFDGLRPVARHQRVYGLLADELAGPIHALALHLYTPDEFQSAQIPLSPNCLGGSKQH